MVALAGHMSRLFQGDTGMKAEQQMWQSVLRRDPAADGAFVYGVVTTGVFCRPTCPARRPKRINVRFYADAAAAGAAGLRPCRRCHPGGISAAQRHILAVTAACRVLRRAGDGSSLVDLATASGMSPWYFQRVFKRLVGITPKQYAMVCREQRFRELLRADHRVTDAIYDAGYHSPAAAYAASRKGLGMAPSRYQGGGQGMTVRYALAATDLGWVMVAVIARGVCGIELADTKTQLREAVRTRFPRARLVEEHDALEQIIGAVVGFVKTPADGLDLPLDIQGTAFQRRVWQALTAIPVGEVRSYGEIARAVGRPDAVRAVASACGQNRIALAVPCHRVVRADGGLGGYRWGLPRKRRLLKGEKE